MSIFKTREKRAALPPPPKGGGLRARVRMMKTVIAGLLFILVVFAEAFGAENSAAEILAKADEVRNPAQSYFLKVRVDSSDNPREPHLLLVAIQGSTKTLIETIDPVRDRGRNMLMLGEDMWAYIPNLKRAVRVALNQKLIGEAANGDISRTRWSGDYDGTVEEENDSEWQLMLVANKKGLTYDRIRVWIEKESYHPLRAEYLTLGGKKLKNVTYRDYRLLEGKMRPGEIVIEDAVRPSERSVIKIEGMKVRTFPAAFFNKNTIGSRQLRS